MDKSNRKLKILQLKPDIYIYIQVGYIKIRIYENDFSPPAKVLLCVTKNLPDISKSAYIKAIFLSQLTAHIGYINFLPSFCDLCL